MAIQFIQRTSMTTGNSSTASATFSKPSRIGHLLVAGLVYASSGSPSTPSGWTNAVTNTGSGAYIKFFYYPSAPSLNTISVSLGSSIRWTIIMLEYANTDSSSPLDTTATGTTGGSAGSITTGTTTDEIILSLFATSNASLTGTIGYNYTWNGSSSPNPNLITYTTNGLSQGCELYSAYTTEHGKTFSSSDDSYMGGATAAFLGNGQTEIYNEAPIMLMHSA